MDVKSFSDWIATTPFCTALHEFKAAGWHEDVTVLLEFLREQYKDYLLKTWQEHEIAARPWLAREFPT